jgi:hypothetical protein
VFKKLEGGYSVLLALGPTGAAGAAAVTGIIEDEGRDASIGKEALDGKPLRHDFADSVTDEDGCSSGLSDWFDKHCIEQALSAGNLMARC